MDGTGYSVLLVPVPALEPFVRARLRRWAPDYLQPDPDAVHAHITVLGPFLPRPRLGAAVLARLANLVAATAPFTVTLHRLGRFPGSGLVHLLPEPSGPFHELTRRVHREWPHCPPYGGGFARVVPHLSLDHAPSTGDLAAELAPVLPARSLVEHVRLDWYEPRRCRTLARFPLSGAGGTPAGPAR